VSSTTYATFATVFGLIAFGHGLLAWTTWQRGRRGTSLNYLLASTVLFAGAASCCAVLG